MVELVDDFARVWTIVVRVRRTSSTGRSTRNKVVAEPVQEHGGSAAGDMLPPGLVQFVLEHFTGLEEVHIVVL